MLFQFSYRRKRIHGISGETTHTLCNDKIDFAVQSIFYAIDWISDGISGLWDNTVGSAVDAITDEIWDIMFE